MAHKKGLGSTKNGRDSKPKYRGVKVFGGQVVKAGNIIIRQKGTKFHPGQNVNMGRDFTIYSLIPGRVQFGRMNKTKMKVSVEPIAVAAE